MRAVQALGLPPASGHLHPLLKVRTQFRKIFTQMGFTEMPTANYVESSFWNFDALFQPQQHPARDAHDTFFLSEPAATPAARVPQDYLGRVKAVHESGGFGSVGCASHSRPPVARPLPDCYQHLHAAAAAASGWHGVGLGARCSESCGVCGGTCLSDSGFVTPGCHAPVRGAAFVRLSMRLFCGPLCACCAVTRMSELHA